MKKNIFAVIVLLGLVGYGTYEYMSGNTATTETQEETVIDENVTIGIGKGQRAPDFQLEDANGNAYKLSDFRGKKVFVNFWATWCPPCRAEMPHMQQVYDDHEGDVVVLGVNLTPTETDPEAIEPFIEDFELTFPIVLDHEGDVMTTYQVIAYPTTFAVDSQGIIREIFRGAINTEIMNEALKKM
mgnify:CR=1 FL=1